MKPAIFVDHLTDIIPGQHGYNVNLKIIQVNLIRFNEYEIEGVAGDCTGIINFRVEGKYADLVEKSLGKTLAFRNVNSEVIKGFHRIRIDLWGKITSSTVTIGEIHPNVRNLS